METIKLISEVIGFVTALLGFGLKIKPLKFKHMPTDHVLYYILLAAFVLFIAALCYLAKLHQPK